MENLVWILLAAIASGFGGYFGSYLKKKGENLATHEDLDKLVQQMEATTQATKAIEARIDDQVWNKQRQWELKRDILLDAIRSISAFENTMMEFGAVFQTANKSDNATGDTWDAHKNEVLMKWTAASRQFENARMLAAVVSGADLRDAFDGLAKSFQASYRVLKEGKGDAEFHNAISDVQKNSAFVLFMLRIELDIPEKRSILSTSQSSESSATPTPDS
jgi:hypothetical protein